MLKEIIFLPVISLVLLTIIVWGRMLFVRVAAMKSVKIHPEKLKSQKAKSLLPDDANIPAENFANLFEVPVLFYLLATFLYVSDSVSWFYIIAGFSYVLLRYAHSFIALTYNKVMHRFTVYLLSCLVLWIMWGAFSYHAIATII